MGRESGVLQGCIVDSWSQSEQTGRNIVGKVSWILGHSLSQ